MSKHLDRDRSESMGRRPVPHAHSAAESADFAWSRLDELRGLHACWADGEAAGVIEGASLIVQARGAGLRVVPLEAIERISASEGIVSLEPSADPHDLSHHRSVRRLGDRWRIDLTLDAPRMDPEYWLARCEGFLINSKTADIGVIHALMRDAAGHTEALLVRTGGLRGHEFIIPVEDVVEIVPRARVIVVRDLPEGHDSEPPRGRGVVSQALSWLRPSG